MRRLLALLCVVSMLLGVCIPVYAEEETPTLTIGNLVVDAGQEVEVPIRILNNTGILGATITITYAKELTLTKIQKGDAFTSLTMTKPGKLSANPINIVWDGESDADVSNGTIAILTFTAPKVNGKYSITISYKSGAVVDADLNPVSLNIENGTVEVQNGDHIHTLIEHAAKDATCTENGNDAYWSCSDCNKLFSDADAVNEIEEIPEIKAIGHKTELENAKSATCMAEGYTGDEVCTVCNEIIKQGEAIAKLEHTYDDGVVTTEPTCVKEGVKTYTCTVCGDSYTESIEKVAHKTELKNVKAATSTAEGYTGDEVCTVCNEIIKHGEAIAKLEYGFVDGRYYIDGVMQVNLGLIKVDDDYYYIHGNGAVETGTFYVNAGKANGLLPAGTYAFGEDGKLQLEDGFVDGRYYIGGVMQVNLGLIKVDDDYYYIHGNGTVETGTFYVNAGKANGLLPAGTYIFGEDGKLQLKNGFVDGKYYVDGVMQVNLGLIKVDGDYYYIHGNGTVETGTLYVNAGKTNSLLPAGTYTFGADGKLQLKNGFVDGKYYVDGVMQVNLGLIKVGDDYYYIHGNGAVETGTLYVNAGKTNGLLPAGTYVFGEDGKLVFDNN